MIQIAFEPAFDPYHTAFRLMLQAHYAESSITISKARIFDVFILEPFRVERIRVPSKMKKNKRSAAECQDPFYGNRPSTQSLFNQMRPIQDAAMQTLALRDIFSMEHFQSDRIEAKYENYPTKIRQKIEVEVEKIQPLLDFLFEDLNQFPFDGVGGIKDRTQLGEFKYDIV